MIWGVCPAGRRPFARRFLQIVLEELLYDGGVGILGPALYGDGDGVALLDAQAHQGHQLRACGGFAVCLGNGDGAVQGLDGLDQQPGGTCVDAHRVGDGVGELFYGDTSFLFLYLRDDIF